MTWRPQCLLIRNAQPTSRAEVYFLGAEQLPRYYHYTPYPLPQVASQACSAVSRRSRGRDGLPLGQGEIKGAALAFYAFGPQPATVGLHQMFGNGQP